MQALKEAGCTEVVLAINYQPKVRSAVKHALLRRICSPPRPQNGFGLASGLSQGFSPRDLVTRCLCCHVPLYTPVSIAQVMMDFLKEWEKKLAIKITCSQVPRTACSRTPLCSLGALDFGSCTSTRHLGPARSSDQMRVWSRGAQLPAGAPRWKAPGSILLQSRHSAIAALAAWDAALAA